ncbi:MAG: outer membrane protein assembly factor BamB family protein [Ktedonobacteraceae bacterium]
MQHIPDPEHAGENKSEVEITDLDSPTETGKVPGRPTKLRRVSKFRVRAWMSIAVIVAITLLIVTVLVSILHLPEAAKVPEPSLPVNYPVSLSAAGGICYVSSTTGVVTALRVNDGGVLWHYASGKAGEGSITVVDGVIYLAPLYPSGSNASTVTIEALRARDGSQLWIRTFPTDSPSTFQFTVVNNVVYVESEIEKMDALRASDGSSLWNYTPHVPVIALPSIANGIAYVVTQDNHVSALRVSDGLPLWTYHSPIPIEPVSPIEANGMLYLSVQYGGIVALHANTGMLLWRYTLSDPALYVYPQYLVANGIIYALTQDGHLFALRASDGSTIWRVLLNAYDMLPPLTIAGGEIYITAPDGSVDALRENSGSVLWHYQGGGPSSITVVQGVLYPTFYASSGVNTITALRASDGFVLWRYTPHVPAMQVLPVTTDGLILIALQDGSINALSSTSSSLRWRRLM